MYFLNFFIIKNTKNVTVLKPFDERADASIYPLFIDFRNIDSGARERAQWLSVPIVSIRQFVIASTPAPGDPVPSSGSHGHQHTCGILFTQDINTHK